MSNAFADIVAQWREAGFLPAQDVPREPVRFDATAYVRQQRLERFKEFCPAEFREKIDRTRIPNLAAWDEADVWRGDHPGLFIWSHDTGLAKSRMLWRKFGQLHVEHGKTVVRVTGLNLSEEYHDAYHHNKTSEFYSGLMRFGVVMLDDLDKMPLPELRQGFAQHANADRNARMLREIFDRFYQHHTPVLVTANEPMTWFEERIGASGGRRMREVCREIAF